MPPSHDETRTHLKLPTLKAPVWVPDAIRGLLAVPWVAGPMLSDRELRDD